MKYVPFETLKGKTLTEVNVEEDERITFVTTDGEKYAMEHFQDCCESVGIESIVGDIEDLVGSEILLAEEVSNNIDDPPQQDNDYYKPESYTWTFYKLATIKGYVDIRWFGSSNGYYSVSVTFYLEEE